MLFTQIARPYFIGISCGFVSGLVFYSLTFAVEACEVFLGPSCVTWSENFPVSFYGVYFSIFSITIPTLILTFMYVEYLTYRRSKSKFDFLVNSAHELYLASVENTENLRRIRYYLTQLKDRYKNPEDQLSLENYPMKIQEFGEDSDVHENLRYLHIPRSLFMVPEIRDLVNKHLYRFLQVFPSTYNGNPTAFTCSVMFMSSFLDRKPLNRDSDESQSHYKLQHYYVSETEREHLEIIFYTDESSRTPFLKESYKKFSFEENNEKEIVFSLKVARLGTTKMEITDDARKKGSFLAQSGADRYKHSILNIPLIDKENNVFGIISIDSSTDIFSGDDMVTLYVDKVLAPFRDQLERFFLELIEIPVEIDTEK